jgi:tetratricopeptide (TPR) repeat protein
MVSAIYWLASAEDYLDRSTEALRDFRRAADLYEQLLHNEPIDCGCRAGLGATFHNIARILADTGRPAEAVEPYRKAIEHREFIVRESPANVQWQGDCGSTWYRLGEALEALGRTGEAVQAHRSALAHQRQVCAREPGQVLHRKCLDDQLRHLSWLLLTLGRTAEASAIAQERKGLQPDDPAVILSVAGELGLAASLVRPGESLLAHILSDETRDLAVSAVAALHDAAQLTARRPVVGR